MPNICFFLNSPPFWKCKNKPVRIETQRSRCLTPMLPNSFEYLLQNNIAVEQEAVDRKVDGVDFTKYSIAKFFRRAKNKIV